MMPLPTRPHLTTRTHDVFAIAQDLANRHGSDHATPVHLTLALLQESINSAAQILLYRCQLPRATLQRELEALLLPSGVPRSSGAARAWNASDEQILESAAAEARGLGLPYVGCEHLFLAFLRDPTTEPAQLLARRGVSFDSFQKDVLRIYDGTMIWAGPAA